MSSALEDYMKRMGLGSNTTGSLGLSAPPPPEIPKFTALGDRLAARGGFGDQPGELKTIDELKKLSPQEIEEYKKERAKARNLGIRESLVAFGESLQGQPGYQNLLERQKARQLIDQNALAKQKFYEAYAAADPRTKEMMNQFIGSELDWLEASKTYSAKKLFGEEKDRRIVQGPDGFNYYVNPDGTFERVLPGLEKPMTEKQKYDELAAQIKQEIALRGRGSAAFDEQQGGNPNLLEFYDTYIVGGNIDPFKAALAGLFGQGNGVTPPPSQKSYKVIGASYIGQSADKVIQNAMAVNPGMSKEKVIQNLIAQGIISEG